ncbi:hypothetical protein OAN307_c34490 [Octadecabacter antarcticus 307]|uniref:Secreted protein n=1 Tax=Octadecabacter antarcticus 307 TaxID=391626 RepID=M9R9S6_9RHOB|nr:hypothetical protein OAN307_c34490 [Octadecabacter antarcticus 307]
MYLAPDAALWATMLACVPLAFALSFDASAVHCPAVVCLPTMRRDQEVRRPRRSLVWNNNGQRPLPLSLKLRFDCRAVADTKR